MCKKHLWKNQFDWEFFVDTTAQNYPLSLQLAVLFLSDGADFHFSRIMCNMWASCTSQNSVCSNDTSSPGQVGFFSCRILRISFNFSADFPQILAARRFAAARGEGWQAPNDTYWAWACELTEYVTTGELAQVHTIHIKWGALEDLLIGVH